MIPTQEQDRCTDGFLTGKNMKINAYAGAGKTSTLKLMARAKISPGTYLCFNKPIAEEAAKHFPETVACRTTHSFAYRQMIQRYRNSGREKMGGSVRARDTVDILGIKDFPTFAGTDRLDATTVAYLVNESLKRFYRSDSLEVARDHFFIIPKAKVLPEDEFKYLRDKVLAYTNTLWEICSDPNTTVPLGHDGYVKAWQLSDPVIDTCYILVDEAQDTNPVMLDILRRQDAQLVYVGDRHQQIYEWRGAVNAMETAPAELIVNLTKSFRFGQDIADFASNILATIGETNRITGNENIVSNLSKDRQRTILCRTNSQILDTILDVEDLTPEKSVHVVTGVKDLIDCMEGVDRLQNKRQSAYNLFVGFKDWSEFELYAQQTGDGEAGKIIKLVNKYGPRRLKDALVNLHSSEANADILLTTAHKSKGREWKGVELADDFKPQPEKDPDSKESTYNPSETRLFYVAATRAINTLKVPQWALDIYGGRSEDSEKSNGEAVSADPVTPTNT
jgi:superfamily I DNA/RNA helicase